MVISIGSQKGGVGKTSTAVSLGGPGLARDIYDLVQDFVTHYGGQEC